MKKLKPEQITEIIEKDIAQRTKTKTHRVRREVQELIDYDGPISYCDITCGRIILERSELFALELGLEQKVKQVQNWNQRRQRVFDMTNHEDLLFFRKMQGKNCNDGSWLTFRHSDFETPKEPFYADIRYMKFDNSIWVYKRKLFGDVVAEQDVKKLRTLLCQK